MKTVKSKSLRELLTAVKKDGGSTGGERLVFFYNKASGVYVTNIRNAKVVNPR